MTNSVIMRFYGSNLFLLGGLLFFGFVLIKYIMLHDGKYFPPTVSYAIRRNMKLVKIGTAIAYICLMIYFTVVFFLPFAQDIPYAIQGKSEKTSGCITKYYEGSKWVHDQIEVKTSDGYQKFDIGKSKYIKPGTSVEIYYFPNTRAAQVNVNSKMQCNV